ncbi:AIPR family protein [Actinosynnema sp. NPDC020468]|uniref:AIPR family protein n=1 Tax=Actinosynnema sp. NPDC020468 TaxID=3154488 RepID=UPI00340455AB
MPLQVRHVAEQLQRDFGLHIDMRDLSGRAEAERDQAFLSRALTALALQDLTGCKPEEAAAGVIDGADDNGIDGIAVDSASKRLWLVQSKWSDKGRAGLDQAAALKLDRGVRLLQDGDYEKFNERFQKLVKSVDEVIGTAGVQITLVIALMGDTQISDVVRQDLDAIVDQLNELEPLAELKVMRFADFYKIVRNGLADTKISLEARLENWGQLSDPYRAYYGILPVVDVAAWYSEHGVKLFAQNIRRPLGLTEVNQKLRTTLRENPEHFWYFNNGITVLCDSLRKSPRGSSNAAGDFTLTGASIVNGAQTVKAIHDSVQTAPGTSDARVWVRLISLESCPPEFADEVTQATNTQNQVEARDFVALDDRQRNLRTEFVLNLRKTYVIARGDAEPLSDSGCTVVEAARALAAAHPDPTFAARAKASDSVLWETGPTGTYHALFTSRTNAFQVWRSVELLRQVNGLLQAERDSREGRAARVAEEAEFLTAHIIFQHIGTREIGNADYDWGAALGRVPALTSTVLDWLIHWIDSKYPSTSFIPPTLRNPQRCAELAALVLADLRSGAPAPDLPSEYRSSSQARGTRTVNAVIALVNAAAITDGTILEFRPQGATEKRVLDGWLAEDPQRGQATWVNNRAKPLLWAADGGRYSPSGLVKDMLRQAGQRIKAVQGTSRWYANGRSLVEIADQVRAEDI